MSESLKADFKRLELKQQQEQPKDICPHAYKPAFEGAEFARCCQIAQDTCCLPIEYRENFQTCFIAINNASR